MEGKVGSRRGKAGCERKADNGVKKGGKMDGKAAVAGKGRLRVGKEGLL